MNRKKMNFFIVVAFATVAGFAVIATHSNSARISWDEGFHGGAALLIRQAVLYFCHISTDWPFYLAHEFTNGITLYPPLWTGFAGILGLIFGPSTAIFRFATTVFYMASIVSVYVFLKTAFPNNDTHGRIAGTVSAVVLATTPLVVIYSHLMMLEVPLMLGIGACVMAFYAYVMDLLPKSKKTIAWISILFFLGPLTKLPAIAIIWAIILVFIASSSILFRKEKFYRHFCKPELLVFFFASILGIALYSIAVARGMVGFFIGQSETQGGLFTILWDRKFFYLKDFLHMPVVSAIWAASLFGYFAWKRTPLGLLLVLWALGIYGAFSCVLPQVVQYVLPMAMPIALACGLMLSEVATKIADRRRRTASIIAITAIFAVGQIASIPLSESYAWRSDESGIQAAAQELSRNARDGDRVAVWHDAVAYSIRIETRGKNIQEGRGNGDLDPQTLKDGYEWAIVAGEADNEISDTSRDILASKPWRTFATFGPEGKTKLYHNETAGLPLTINLSAERQGLKAGKIAFGDPDIITSYRLISSKRHTMRASIKPLSIPKDIPDEETVASASVWVYELRGTKKITKNITAGDFRKSSEYADFVIDYGDTHVDAEISVRVSVLKEKVSIAADTVIFE